MKKVIIAVLLCLTLFSAKSYAADRHIRTVWAEMGFPQNEIVFSNNVLHLKHENQKVDIPIGKSKGITYTINGYEDKFQNKAYLKDKKVYISDYEIKTIFGFWKKEPIKPEITGNDEFKKQVNFYLDYMKKHMPYFYKFVCDNLTTIIEKEDMDNETAALVYKGDISGKCYMKLLEDRDMMYGTLIHEAKHVYDYKNNPDIDKYTLESNAYKLDAMALISIGYWEKDINDSIDKILQKLDK